VGDRRMSRKHYIEVARILREAREAGEIRVETLHLLMADFIELFQADNPRFDQDRFERACLGLK
jgi:hypothetical protein